MLPPCGGCPDRFPACSDTCQKQEYLDYKRLLELKKADARWRGECGSIDAKQNIKRRPRTK